MRNEEFERIERGLRALQEEMVEGGGEYEDAFNEHIESLREAEGTPIIVISNKEYITDGIGYGLTQVPGIIVVGGITVGEGRLTEEAARAIKSMRAVVVYSGVDISELDDIIDFNGMTATMNLNIDEGRAKKAAEIAKKSCEEFKDEPIEDLIALTVSACVHEQFDAFAASLLYENCKGGAPRLADVLGL